MVPLLLRVKNFCQHRSAEIKFNFGITGIVGKNGNGKTNLIDVALYFAITGQVVDENKTEQLTWGETEGWTLFKFMHQGRTYDLKRSLHNSGATLSWRAPDKTSGEIKGITSVNAEMQQILGMSFDIFRETCFCSQYGLTQVLVLPSSQRMMYFQKIMGLQKTETLRGVIQEKLNALPIIRNPKQEIEDTEKVLSGYDVELSGIVLDDVDILTQQRVTLLTKLQSVYSKNDQQKDLAILDNKINSKRAGLPTTEVAKPGQEPEKTTKEEDEYFAASEENKNTLSVLSENVKRINEIESDYEESISEPVSDFVDDLREMLLKAQPTYTAAKTGICPTCGHKPDNLPATPEEIIKNYEQAQEHLKILQKDYEQKLAKYNAWKVKKASKDKQLEAYRVKAELHRQRLKNVPDSFDPTAYLLKRTAYTKWSEENTTYLSAVAKSAKVYAEIEQLNSEREKILERQTVADEEKQNWEKEEKLLSRKLEELRKKQARQIELVTLKRHTENRLEKLKEEDLMFAKYLAVRDNLEQAKNVLHRDCLPRVVMSKMLASLNALLEFYLVKFQVKFTAQIDEDFNFKVLFKNGPVKSASRLSGGQRTVLAVAFRFALSDLFSKNIPVLVLDEPTAWLDGPNKQAMVDVLQLAKEFVEKGVYVFIITHDSVLLPAMSRAIEIKTNND